MADHLSESAQNQGAYDLSPTAAAERLVELSATFRGQRPALAEIPAHELSPAEAGERLAAMEKLCRESTKPKNAPADAAIVGEQPPREFETVSWPAISTRNKLSAIDGFRELGFPEPGIVRLVSGEGPITPDDVNTAQAIKRAFASDRDLRAKLLAGDKDLQMELVAAEHILIRAREEEARTRGEAA